MPHKNFNPDSIDWLPFFVAPQTGGGAYFIGRPYMHGGGFASFFSPIVRFILPLLASAGKEVGREGISAGARILGDIAQGQDPKKAVIEHGREGLGNLMEKATKKVKQQGSGKKRKKRQQKGRGKQTYTYKAKAPKGKKRKAKSVPPSPFTGRLIGNFPKIKRRKFQRFDSLGPY